MKLVKRILFSLTLVLLCTVYFKVLMRQQAMRARGPLTVEGLDKLASRWGLVVQVNTQQADGIVGAPDITPATNDVSAAFDDSPPKDVARERPALKRALTEEERKEITEFQRQTSTVVDKLSLPFCKFMATIYQSVGIDEGAGFSYYDAAGVAYVLGDFETARLYYREALTYPLYEAWRTRSCFRLAWLEDDPEVATKLLELACPEGESGRNLYGATNLALRTGSEELFNSYLDRLRAQLPESGREFDLRISRGSAPWLEPVENRNPVPKARV